MPHANCGRKDCYHPVVAWAKTPNLIATHKCMIVSVVARPGFACATANQKGNKRRSRPGQPRGVLRIWNLNVAFLQSWTLAEATTRGFSAACCQIHLTAVPFGVKQNLSSAAPRNRQPATHCPLNLYGCALSFDFVYCWPNSRPVG